MLSEDGFVKLYRKLTEWEWYDDIPTKVVFFHLLLTVNWKDKKWHGIDIKRGEKIISWSHLAEETCLSVQQVRTAIEHLESTGEVTRCQQGKFSVVAIKNYAVYQDDNRMITTCQQDDNKMITGCQQDGNKMVTTTKEKKEEKEGKNINIHAPVRARDLFTEYAGEDAGLREALFNFDDMRKAIKKPLTAAAAKLLIGKLNNMPDKVKALQESTERCWLSVYDMPHDNTAQYIKKEMPKNTSSNKSVPGDIEIIMQAIKEA